MTNAFGELVQELSYNRINLPVTQKDASGNQTDFTYESDGQLKEVRRGNTQRQQTPRAVQQYEYNARGQITGIVDGNHEKTIYSTDGWGRITGTGFSDGVKEGYEYNYAGQVSRTINGNGNAIEYRYNSLGKVRERTDQLGYKETFEYDEEGNLALHTDRDGRQVQRIYNVFGDPVYEKAVDAGGENPCISTWRYDSLGRLIHAVCDGHSYEYAYDNQGNLKEKRSNGKLLVAYTYDSTGNITEIKDPAGISTRYEYDLLGRMTCIHSGQGMNVQYGYDSLDRIEHIHYGNGVQTNYAYDCDGNISHLETRTESAVLLSFDYKYDGNGNRTAKTGIQGLTAGSSALDVRYQYDVRGQLLEECRNGAAVRYAYDAAGNRIRKTEGEKETRYRYNQKNQLLQKEDADGISCFTYDRQGGIIEEKNAAGIRRFTYNSLHQQTQVETETGNIQKNRYDAEGLRYELIENGRRTSFVYHNGELLHEKGEEAETSYHLGAGIEAFQRDRKTYYYHQDEQLNTTLISDENASIKNHYQYDAFGAGLEEAEALSNRIRYTGQQYDGQTGQYYLRARYYNPVLGRFMQEDVYQGDGLNLYAYCANNPVVYYDPSGYGKHIDYSSIKKELWPADNVEINRITGSPDIPTLSNGFREWFDGLSKPQLEELYKTQTIKDKIKKNLRGGSKVHNHEWNMVAHADQFKNWGLTASDIMDNATPTKNVYFKNILNTSTNERISGAHTGTSAGRYAHIKLENLISESKCYSDYVTKLRGWADKHVRGGSESLPGHLKRGQEIPEHIREYEMQQTQC